MPTMLAHTYKYANGISLLTVEFSAKIFHNVGSRGHFTWNLTSLQNTLNSSRLSNTRCCFHEWFLS